MKTKINYLGSEYIVLFALFTILSRLIPHAPNLAPLTALAMLAGIFFRPRVALASIFLTALISDLLIAPYNPKIMAFVYLSHLLAVGIGILISKRKSFTNAIFGSAAGSTVFFIVSNWAVWAFGTLYVNSASGLLQSYIMGLPFWRNSFIADMIYGAVFYGIFSYLQAQETKSAVSLIPETNTVT